ncbi:hypothetical protein IT411_02820 [Candidatus Peregrinibacteria bacterium]|nr:hypothetical protein [Candidatus Peregrinibacteria bacterium]
MKRLNNTTSELDQAFTELRDTVQDISHQDNTQNLFRELILCSTFPAEKVDEKPELGPIQPGPLMQHIANLERNNPNPTRSNFLYRARQKALQYENGYRENSLGSYNTELAANLWAFLEKESDENALHTPESAYQEYIAQECETILDTVFLQAAIRGKFGGIDQTGELARFIFGDDSRIEERVRYCLSLPESKDIRHALTGSAQIIVGIMLFIYAMARYMDHHGKFNGLFDELSVALPGIIGLACAKGGIGEGTNLLTTKTCENKKYHRQKYQQIPETPEIEQLNQYLSQLSTLVRQYSETQDKSVKAELEAKILDLRAILEQNHSIYRRKFKDSETISLPISEVEPVNTDHIRVHSVDQQNEKSEDEESKENCSTEDEEDLDEDDFLNPITPEKLEQRMHQ